MKIYTKEKIWQMKSHDDNPVEPMLFQIPKGMMRFMWYVLKHTVCKQPVRWGLQVVFLVLFFMYGLATGYWTALFIFLTLTIVLRGLLLFNYARLYRVLKNGCYHRVDKYGLSLIAGNEDTGFIRCYTDSWKLVKSVYAYDSFIVVNMEDASEGASEHILSSCDTTEALNNIIALWHQDIKGVEPGKTPDDYTDNERNTVLAAIEERFGRICFMLHVPEASQYLNLDLAMMKPTDGRPYYTVCTIGAGALRMDMSKEERMEEHTSEHIEYVTYLPADWIGDIEEIEDMKQKWPLDMLIDCVLEMVNPEQDFHFTPNSLFDFNRPLGSDTDATGVYVDSPLPDPATSVYINIAQTGRTVEYLQVIPISQEEIELYNSNSITNYDDIYRFLFDIDLNALADDRDEERQRVFQQKILEHFKKRLL